ncbi:D-beta-hydroxybutyrate dehydrogenase-like protein, partial [Leptotrombidium deliense]
VIHQISSGIWALINNAGICIFGEFDWCSIDQCQKQIEVNLMGTIRVTKHFLGSIIKSKGRIINISSVNSMCAIPGSAVYSSTKCAINGFSDSLRYEVEKFGVKVIVINPGDFSRITKIMDRHESHVEEMWNYMSPVKRNLYGNYFREYQEHVIAQFGVTSAKRFEDTTLFDDVQEAVHCKQPRLIITCAPLSSRVSMFILSKLPITLRHKLFDFLLNYIFKLHVDNFFKIK